MNIERNDDRILIKYVDSNFNTFKCVITTDDVFVVNFCRRDLSLLEDILKNNTLIEMDDYYVLRVEKPIFLEYQLKKEKQEEITNLRLILEKFKILEEENRVMKENFEKFNQILDENRKIIVRLENENTRLQMKIGNIDYRLGDGILLPGFLGGIIPRNTKYLFLYRHKSPYEDIYDYTLRNEEESQNYNGFHRCIFLGDSLEPLSQLQELEWIQFGYFREEIDITPLFKCEKLRLIRAKYCVKFSFFSDVPKTIKKDTKLERDQVYQGGDTISYSITKE